MKPYPTRLLEGCDNALLLFCAGFLGENDGDHFWTAGIEHVFGIDRDEAKIAAMRRKFPGWELYADDVFAWIDMEPSLRFDVVSVDPDSGLDQRVRELVPAFCDLARKAVVLGTVSEGPVEVPEGWRVELRVRRNARASWVPIVRSE